MTQDDISLNKFISSRGICSRREADRMIEGGRVTINGKVAKKGNRVSPGDEVTVDGEQITKKQKDIYILFHKPPGVTCTTDTKDKTNIIDFIGHEQRIFPVGRLDKTSSGLILLTNNGDIVNRILRAENKQEKEYLVKINKPVNKAFIKRMSEGVPILGTVTKECEVEKVGKQSFRIVLVQGLNRQIRRMCEHLGCRVHELTRIRIMHLSMGRLQPGKWRNLKGHELETLKKRIGL